MVTITLPVVAVAGMGATMLVPLQLVGVAATPLKFRVLDPCVAPNPVPVMVTFVPTTPDAGETLVIVCALTGKGNKKTRTNGNAAIQACAFSGLWRRAPRIGLGNARFSVLEATSLARFNLIGFAPIQ